MKKLKINYPWESTEKDEGFFVPCLDTQAVKEEGLQEALRHRIFNAKAKIGTKHQKLGVWFYR
jgi:hypothetical protein